MKITLTPTLLSLPLLAQLALGQDNSQLFSQYIGATTATAHFAGPSSSLLAIEFTACTNYLHGLAAIPTDLPSTAEAPLIQIQVDGVCEICTSLSQSRIDSCCGVSTSVDCFDQFKSGAAATQTTPVSVSATTTPGSSPATATGATPAATTSKSSGERVDVVSLRRRRSRDIWALICVTGNYCGSRGRHLGIR